MKEKVIVSCAFGDIYLPLLKRQIEKCQLNCPECDHVYWIGEYPPNSKLHSQSMYGFKVHAIRYVMNLGYKKVLWIDSAVYPTRSIDYIWKIVDERGVFAPKDSLLLSQHSFPHVMEYFGYNYEYLKDKDWTIAAGAAYAFDFNNPIAISIFEAFEKAEDKGLFCSQKETSEQKCNDIFKGTRWDETCMGFIMKNHGITLHQVPFMGDENDPNFSFATKRTV